MNKRISIHTKTNIYFVDPEKIIYCKCNNTSTTFFLDNMESLVISKGIKSVEKLLDNPLFIKPHQSYLVNRSYISIVDKMNDYALILSNHERIPIATRRRKEILDIISTGIDVTN